MSSKSTPCGPFINAAPLVLASASPRRRHFLTQLGITFSTDPADIDETPLPSEEPARFVERAAREKAATVAARHPDAWVLAADTVVVLEGNILGKPDSAVDAEKMLERLAGRWHEVWTGYCIAGGGPARALARTIRTEVLFAPVSAPLLQAYVATGEPLDKAGAYGIQGIGGFLVESIRGSYSNVVGLPLAEVTNDLLTLGVLVPGTGQQKFTAPPQCSETPGKSPFR